MVFTSSRRRYLEFRRRPLPERNRDGQLLPRVPQDAASSRQPRTFLQLFRAFLGLLRGHHATIAFSLATLTGATLLKLAPPAATKISIDYVLTDRPLPPQLAWLLPASANGLQLLLVISAAVLAVTLLSTGLQLWGRWQATLAVNRVQIELRRRVFEHAIRLPLHRVYQLKSGGAASLLREDAGAVAELIFSLLYNPWRAVIQLLGILLVLAWVDWRLMLGGLLLVPIVYLTHRTWVSRIRPIYRDIRGQRQELDSYCTEAFGGMRLVRAFARERSETARFVRDNNLMIRKQLYVWWWARAIDLVWDIAVPTASAGILIYGGYGILQGRLTMGDMTMFLVYLAMLLGPLATLAASATEFQNSLAALDRVLDLLDEPREAAAAVGSRSVSRGSVAGAIEFRGVSFCYPSSSQRVLEDISLEVRPGETVALVGRSGAGKTTLCNLVARFYDPTAGTIQLDGIDLREIVLDSYRGLLGIVEQDVFLFDGTVADNIGYALRRPPREAIEAAARAANAHEFIQRLGRGYDSVIGERGVKLSGGQRQRLAIARVILADPRILILDEATSNLDSESEKLIQRSLQSLLRGRTCFVIAHRLSTVTHANRIVVLDGGRIVEVGTHAELLQRGGLYRHMVELQMSDQPLLVSGS